MDELDAQFREVESWSDARLSAELAQAARDERRSRVRLTVKARGWDGLLHNLAPRWPERFRRHWRDDGKDPILPGVRAAAITVALGRGRFGFNVATLTRSIARSIRCIWPRRSLIAATRRWEGLDIGIQ